MFEKTILLEIDGQSLLFLQGPKIQFTEPFNLTEKILVLLECLSNVN